MKIRQSLILLILTAFPVGVLAQTGPHWWYEYDVISSDPADDYAAVNQGQLKHFAYQAYQYLEDNLPGGAGTELDTLINSWDSPGSGVDDYQSINLGQLKNVSSLYYDRLIEEGFAKAYPWSRPTQGVDDFAMVNLGQLKNVFFFDLVYPTVVALSSNLQVTVSQQVAGGYFQWIEQFGLPLSEQGFHDDPANDGIPNLLKYAMDLDPTIASNASMPVATSFMHDGEEYLGLEFDRPIGTSGISYHLDVSTNLTDWNEVFEPLVVTDESGMPTGYERVWMSEDVPKDELPSLYFLRLRIVLQDPGCRILDLLAVNSNMLLHEVTFIGEPEQRVCFSSGFDYGLGIDQGFVFATGIAEDWNEHNKIQNIEKRLPGDDDLEMWMDAEGFEEFPLDSNNKEDTGTSNAAGVMIEFEPEFSGTGTVKIPFLFSSDEYYEPDGDDDESSTEARNDGMAIFLFEMDSNGVIPSTMVNIGVLPSTDSNSTAINVENVGEVFALFGNPPACNNVGFFRKNSQYSEHYGHTLECSGLVGLPSECGDPSEMLSPCLVGYSGFTERFVGEGTVEGGTKYLLKVVVVDQADGLYNAATFLENGSIVCVPDE